MNALVRERAFETGLGVTLDRWRLRRSLLDPHVARQKPLPRSNGGSGQRRKPPDADPPTRQRSDRKGSLRRTALKLFGGTCLALALGPPILGYARLSSVRAEYAAMNARATAIVVRDRGGRFVGIQPQPLAQSERLYLPSGEVSEDFYQMLRFLEDRPSNNPLRSWYGVNYLSMLRNAGCLVARETIDGDRQCGGASTLAMQSARGTRGMFGGQNQNWIGRKVRELLDAPAISLMFDEGSVEERRFTVDSLSYGSVSGFELWGPRLAARVIFGREPEELSLAQRAIMASLPRYRLPLRCAPVDDEQTRRDDVAREAIRRRAISALAGTFGAGDVRAARAITELRAMRIPHAPSPLPTEMTYGLSPGEACEAAANPQRAVALIASSELIVARDEIREAAAGSDVPVTEAELTIDVPQQRRFKVDVVRLLNRLSSDERQHLQRPIAGSTVPDILLVATRSDGAIRFLYNSAPRPLIDEQRRVGSIAKLVIATAAAGAGMSPHIRICNRPDERGIQNAGGSRGSQVCAGAAMVPITDLFGRSLNLAALELARVVGERRLHQAAAEGGFLIPPGMSAADATSLGMSESRPRSMLAFAQAFARGAAGCSPTAQPAFIVSRIRIGGQWRSPRRRAPISLQRRLAEREAPIFLRLSGGAALTHLNGTLSFITRATPYLPNEIGKSGTNAGPRPDLATLSKLGLGASPHRYSWMSLIAARSGSLGDRHLELPELSEIVRRRIHADTGSRGSARGGPEAADWCASSLSD